MIGTAILRIRTIPRRYLLNDANGTTKITVNRVFKMARNLFNNDSTLTSAVLDRLLHHAETVKIEGRSFRMKNKIGLYLTKEKGAWLQPQF